jgi:Sec-independent protein translocase protein TatA
MNILGVGPAELIAVFIIALVVAGPKRLIVWAYQIGRYVARFRAAMQEAMDAVQKELAASGLDLPQDLAGLQDTRFDLMKEVSKIMDPAQSPPQATQPTPAAPATPSADAPTAPAERAASPAEPETGSAPEPKKENQTPGYDAWTPD